MKVKQFIERLKELEQEKELWFTSCNSDELLIDYDENGDVIMGKFRESQIDDKFIEHKRNKFVQDLFKLDSFLTKISMTTKTSSEIPVTIEFNRNEVGK